MFKNEIDKIIDENLAHFQEIYQHLHKNPELSHQEKETSALVAEELKEMGFEVTTGVGGYGVVGVFKNGKGKTALVRADMDALPIQEETGLPYKSRVRNVMHACGHDLHVSMMLGAAKALTTLKENWKGTLVVIAQPAEEVGEGAKAMLDAGLFKKFPKPDYALATHVAGLRPVGTLSYHKGYSMANVDYVDITIYGKGGHGAMPHTTIDPIVIASQVVIALQTLVSREIDPNDSAVVTVGAINGGSKHNIIPEEVHLQITVRSFEDATRAHLKEGIFRIAENIAVAGRAPKPKIAYREGVPSLYNDPALVDELIPVFEEVVGKENVSESKKEMYGEDFSYFGRNTGVPIFIFWTGSQPKGKTAEPAMHSPRFGPEFEGTFKTGVAAMTGAVLKKQKVKI